MKTASCQLRFLGSAAVTTVFHNLFWHRTDIVMIVLESAGYMTRVTCRLTAKNPGSSPEPYARLSSMGYLFCIRVMLQNDAFGALTLLVGRQEAPGL